MPVYIAKRCMKFTFPGLSEGMLISRLTTSEPEEHYSRLWFISSKTDAGIQLWTWASESIVSPQKISSSFSRRQVYTYRLFEGSPLRKREVVTRVWSLYLIRSIVPCSSIRR